VIDADNTGRKKGKDMDKDLVVFVDERLVEISNSMSTLIGRVDDMKKHLEEIELVGDFEEFRGEAQVAVNSVVVDATKEVQALQASKGTQQEELRAGRVEVEAHKTRVEALEA